MIIENTSPFSTAYISGACNSNPFAADWGQNNIICLAIDDGVAVLKPDLEHEDPGKIEGVFFTHRGRVNAVKWMRTFTSQTENSFISASVDGTAIIWLLTDNDDCLPKYVLKGHTEAVVDVDAISFELSSGDVCMLAASMSIDTLKFWMKSEKNEDFFCCGTFNEPEKGLGVSGLSFALLPDSHTIIFASPKQFVDISLYTCTLTAKSDSFPVFEEKQLLSGHTNWINDVAFTTSSSENILLLASASHDCTIRVWRIASQQGTQHHLGLKESVLVVEDRKYSITLYSILHGHDQWIYSVQWKHFYDEPEEKDKLKLLSVSADKSVIVWQRDLTVDTWVENYRLGDVGGNLSGFLGGCFDPTGQFIMSHDLLGAFHVWRYNKSKDNWSSTVLPSGHNDEVNDIQWDSLGQFLISVSSDKTTRLHAPWHKNASCWYEFSRPQTHGHVISCLTVLPQCRFVSGASEKELRSYIAPKTFVQSFKKFSSLKNVDESKYPHNSAILPSLDLSNKPADEVENVNIEKDEDNGTESDRSIPTEDELCRNTLWPEIQKLYYHPNDISCITSNFDGTLIASACKANSFKEAGIVIWHVNLWNSIERIQELWFHQLTVTQLAFSPDGLYLLSVSRDRTWSVFKKNENENSFTSVSCTTKNNVIHKRQLQACSWSHDSEYFATGSRDGKIVIWGMKHNPISGEKRAGGDSSLNNFSSQYVLSLNDEDIRSLSFSPGFIKSCQYLIAVGFGSGKIGLYVWNATDCQNWFTFGENFAHHKAVTKVTFRPTNDSQDSPKDQNIIQMASSGVDRLVKIYNLNLSCIQPLFL